jgi:UDP-N-acetylglucosamine--N-acetylmuramyl-(pentapeptide) pyrophosphoryl-undecaprenol N-acetylglucosamine transferase
LIQEQNSYAGLTNKFLANKAKCVCVAYPNMQTYFPKTPIVLTGNPVRETIYKALTASKPEAKTALGFDPQKPLCLIIGGSLGARTINQAIQAHAQLLADKGIQLLWQTGQNFSANIEGLNGVQAKAFIQDMATAYAAADIVVSRAGALSISELSLLSKPCILVPSPNVAEDHQTKNAMALSQVQAAFLVKDQNAMTELHMHMVNLINDPSSLSLLSKNIAAFSKPNAIKDIVTQIEQII